MKRNYQPVKKEQFFLHFAGELVFLPAHGLLIAIFKTVVPRRSNRRPDGAQPCKQHSDRALELMLLGDFETAGFAGSKRRHSVPAPAGRRL
ncbi:MAG: hypothetical protein ABF858_07665, partial [Lacticaseibacillus paracasei]